MKKGFMYIYFVLVYIYVYIKHNIIYDKEWFTICWLIGKRKRPWNGGEKKFFFKFIVSL